MKVKSAKGVKKSLPVFLVFKFVIIIIFLSFLPLATAFRGKKGHGQKCFFHYVKNINSTSLNNKLKT
jgi:hypothetical protein